MLLRPRHPKPPPPLAPPFSPPPSSPKASKAWLSRSKAAARLAKGPRPEGSDPERSPERCVEGGFGASSSPLFYIKNLRLLSGLFSGLPPLFALP